MNLGEFIIKIGTQADIKELDKAIQKVEDAEKKTRRLITYLKELSEASSDHEKRLIKKNFVYQLEADKLKAVTQEQKALSDSMQKTIMSTMKMVGAIKLGIIVLDRMGNSLLKANQMYMTFEKQSGISITRLNRMAGIAQMAGTGLSPEQVAGDIQSLQHKIFRFERFGENAKTFGMLGINPRGMDSDKLILSLRKSLSRYNGRVKSEILQELGLSQEWLNVLDLSEEKFNEYLKTSSKLQLTEKERKKLAEYNAKQQQNNMRWELAKNKLLLSVVPLVQQIMEVTSKAALEFAKFLQSKPQWLNVLRDVLILMTGGKLIGVITALTKLLAGGGIAKLLTPLGAAIGVKGIGKAGKTAGGFLAKRGAGMLGGLAGGPIGAIFSIAMGIWTIVDLFKLFNNKQEQQQEEITPDPDEGSPRYQYHNVKSNMTNNFFNNPQPAKEAIEQLSKYHNLILAEQYR